MITPADIHAAMVVITIIAYIIYVVVNNVPISQAILNFPIIILALTLTNLIVIPIYILVTSGFASILTGYASTVRLGIVITIIGLAILIYGITNAYQNGINYTNTLIILVGLGIMQFGIGGMLVVATIMAGGDIVRVMIAFVMTPSLRLTYFAQIFSLIAVVIVITIMFVITFVIIMAAIEDMLTNSSSNGNGSNDNMIRSSGDFTK
jgi:hypothetical protein